MCSEKINGILKREAAQCACKMELQKNAPDDEEKRAVRGEDGTVVIACNFYSPPPPDFN